MKPEARVYDPQGLFMQRWNKIFGVSCLISVALDSLFFYISAIDGDNKCIYLDDKLEIMASILRSVVDIFYLLRIMFQFRTGFVVPSRAIGHRVLVDDACTIAKRYLSTYFLVDFLSVLPLPQVFVLCVMPHLKGSEVMKGRAILMLIILCQYVPRLIRMMPLYLQITRSAGRIMETAWTGAAFNLLIYMIASHMLGALWYTLSIQRQDTCWREACHSRDGCDLEALYCGSIAFGNNTLILQDACPTNGTDDPDLTFGIYLPAIQNVSQSTSFFEKLFYCFWWGLQNLCTYGQNLKASTYTWENLFAVFVSTAGLVLFALLIGNVETYLHSTSVHKEEMRGKDVIRNNGWHIDSFLSISRNELCVMSNIGGKKGVNEEGLLVNLPKDLRREIKRHLCLSLLMRVPMFKNMDDKLLDAMCERLKPMLYTEGSCIICEGGPVNEMLFIMRGYLESMTTNGGRIGFFNSSVLEGDDIHG